MTQSSRRARGFLLKTHAKRQLAATVDALAQHQQKVSGLEHFILPMKPDEDWIPAAQNGIFQT